MQAVEAAMPTYGRSPVTGNPRTATSGPKYSDLAERELARRKSAEEDVNKVSYKDLQDKLVQQELLKQVGAGGVEDIIQPTAPMGNVSTENAPTGSNVDRITSGEEPVASGDFANMGSANLSKSALSAQPVGDETNSAPMGNVSTDNSVVPKIDTSKIDQIISNTEPQPEMDMVSAMQPNMAVSSLFDETAGARPAGARPAGIPEETLNSFFAKTTGSGFDSKSKKDRLMMNKIKDMITGDKSLLGLSPSQFSMKVYGRK